jgi:hypothetical protein
MAIMTANEASLSRRQLSGTRGDEEQVVVTRQTREEERRCSPTDLLAGRDQVVADLLGGVT